MFESLSGNLSTVFDRLRRKGWLHPADIAEALSEIRRALLAADVATAVVTEFVDRVRAEALAADLNRALNPTQQVVRIVQAQLVHTLGGEAMSISFAPRPPTVVLLAGLGGSGKTTAAAKLARWFRGQGRSPLLVGADLSRPAAVEQLRVLAAEIAVPVFSEATDPVAVSLAGVAEARRLGRDVAICDTAGRQVVEAALMAEVRTIGQAVQPHYTFLVLDAMTGQEAVHVARSFHEALGLDAVILTKLDGDARGGAALSVRAAVGTPVAFASVGERVGDFERFHPDRLAGRILGMGDLLSLAEKAEAAAEGRGGAESSAAAERVLVGDFTLEDFLEQMRQMRKLGGLGDVLAHLPSEQAAQANEAGVDERRLARMEAIICSMTPGERAQPAVIDGSRRRRIAAGSGATTAEVGELLRNFSAARKMMRSAGPAAARRKSKRSKGTRARSSGAKSSGRVTPAGGARRRAGADLLEKLEWPEEPSGGSAPGTPLPPSKPLSWPER
ncbi:MAG: signal recognition particle protein [Acidimicrobiia bacterium]|nr:signal recognition particle protein [Acidimicrobiia bacterium]